MDSDKDNCYWCLKNEKCSKTLKYEGMVLGGSGLSDNPYQISRVTVCL